MSRVCNIANKRRSVGFQYSIRGIAKKKGGIGLKIAGKSRRVFLPNLFKKRYWDDQNKRFVKIKLSAAAMRNINKNGLRKVVGL